MTDEQIIKALEICTSGNLFGCDKCAFVEYKIGHDGCYAEMLPSALDLINRQKAEIEKLTVNMNAFGLGMKIEAEKAEKAQAEIERLKAEAIKEFADTLKAKLGVTKNYAIDETLREMVGDDNA